LNLEKQVFIENGAKGKDYWTGLNDIEVEGAYNWETSGQPIPVGHFYLNWGPGQPNDSSHSKNCISVNHGNGTTAQWFNRACTDKLSFICEKHAYDQERNKLPVGKWRAEFITQNGGDSGKMCLLSIHSQSDLNVYYGFGIDMFSDFPYQEPLFNNSNNHMMAHVTGLHEQASHARRFEQTQFYSNKFVLLDTLRVNQRFNCAYPYVTDPFKCPDNIPGMNTDAFGILMTGRDDMDYPWMRIRSAECVDATMTTIRSQLAAEATKKYKVQL